LFSIFEHLLNTGSVLGKLADKGLSQTWSLYSRGP
jgi:hypothetical protein